jgi:diaminopimelate epimerase
MKLPFIKMHALGNDYVYIDCLSRKMDSHMANADLPALARKVSDRHRGIGSDGLVLILPSRVADVRMRMFNADGSEAEMCGNAARCIAKYVFEQRLCGNPLTIETFAGIKQLTPIINAEGRVEQVTVEMGTTLGNPHEVFIVDAADALDPQFKQLCTDARYADLRKRANIECVYVLNRKELRLRVCERGTGETMACGTGACAAAVEAMNKKLTTTKVTVHMPGGDVSVRRDDKGIIYLTGTATEVFRGEYNWED